MKQQLNDPSSEKKKGTGCIRISRDVVDVLIQQASLLQILTYFALARYTDKTGTYSSAGRTAVKKALGIGDDQADRAIESLFLLTTPPDKLNMSGRRLVYSAGDWENISGELFDKQYLKSQVRFFLDQLDNDAGDNEHVWFSNELVDGYGQFKKPLKRLKRLGDISVRLLLYMYRENSMVQFGGVPPHLVSRTYNAKNVDERTHGYNLWHCIPFHFEIEENLALTILRLSCFGTNEEDVTKKMDIVLDALIGLEAAGFVYEMVTVLDSPPGPEANVIYELDMRGRHGYKPKGEEGLAGKTARLAGYLGKSVAKGGAEFTGKYAAFLEAGVTPSFSGIFRLRFRVANPKNHTVSDAFARIFDGQTEWEQVLDGLLKPYDEAREAKPNRDLELVERSS